mmetsp:Transcript_9584/g.20816  ORF Transcript_9584/g.20816 Transcript_9584/m.20816 type:complete len:200 (+) Transcript_9584:1179-1778(+)
MLSAWLISRCSSRLSMRGRSSSRVSPSSRRRASTSVTHSSSRTLTNSVTSIPPRPAFSTAFSRRTCSPSFWTGCGDCCAFSSNSATSSSESAGSAWHAISWTSVGSSEIETFLVGVPAEPVDPPPEDPEDLVSFVAESPLLVRWRGGVLSSSLLVGELERVLDFRDFPDFTDASSPIENDMGSGMLMGFEMSPGASSGV